MRDILPDEAELRDSAARTILDVYRRHGFRRIETPALESIQLLTQGDGGENEKLIFKVLKRGEKLDLATAASEADLVDLGLRFDLTVPLARYYARNQAKLPQPLKAVQIGPVWRAERPQHGRYRQFTQCDIDILGVASEVAEIELILATTEALAALGLGGLTVHLNDRRLLTALATWCGFEPGRQKDVFVTLDKWDKLSPAEIRDELERAGHDPPAVGRMLALFEQETGAWTLDRLRSELGRERVPEAFDALGRILDTVGDAGGGRFGIAFDPTLVRGMGYYTGPIFEIRSAAFASSIAGGGRYDEMIGKLLGREVPATGFSIGFERVIEIRRRAPGVPARAERRVALLFDPRADDLRQVWAAAGRLRAEGHLVSVEVRARSAGGQRAALARHGFDGVATFDPAAPPRIRWLAEEGAPAPPGASS
jgi:histidyl-tRNA synthetase